MLVIQKFIEQFKESIHGAELRATGKEIRAFLEAHGETLTLQAFNRLTGCLGRTTGNLYRYSLPYMLSLTEQGQEKGKREFTEHRIKTLEVYGSKRRWVHEWELLLKYAHSIGCIKVLDLFGGSGFISLLASRLNLFDEIQLNEGSTLVYNFHCVMKSELYFKEFIRELEKIKFMNIEIYNSMKKTLAEQGKAHSVSVRRAMNLFTVKHYSYNAQGAYISRRKAIFHYKNSLQNTHKLYQNVELSSLYYKKLLLEHIKEDDFLIILDPPYLQKLREQKKSYELEFTERQHLTLIQLLSKEVKAKIILCGYEEENGLYSRYLKRSSQKWHCIRLLRNGRLDRQEEEGKEHIWVNFEINSLLSYNDLFEQIF